MKSSVNDLLHTVFTIEAGACHLCDSQYILTKRPRKFFLQYIVLLTLLILYILYIYKKGWDTGYIERNRTLRRQYNFHIFIGVCRKKYNFSKSKC